MNKTVKKIVALGFGALMLGTTAAVATAYDLSDYPAPFVQNGVFQGKIVIGEKAMGIDTVGALDIAASLQRAAGTAVSGSTGGTTAMTEDGYLFSESTDLIYGADLNSVTSTVDDTELPELLASGTVEEDSGDDYDYDVSIQLPASTNVIVNADVNVNDLDDLYSTPVVYFDLASGATDTFYNVVIDFEDTWNAEDFLDSETIELFGRAYTFDPNNDNDENLVLFGSDTTLVVAKGESKTITYDGKDYTVEVLGGNSDDATAILRIGSETKTVTEGDSRTLGGLPIYVKDVFISNIGGDDVSVQLFLGSNKIELEEDTGKVMLNGVELDEVEVAVTPSGDWAAVDTITFTVTPSGADDEVKYILPGEEYVDPLFGSFKFHFVGAEDLMEGKEALKFDRVGKKAQVTFMPRDANDWVAVSLLENGALYDDIFSGGALTDIDEDEIFFFNEFDGDDDKAITHVLQIDSITDGNNVSSDDFEVVVKDLTFDKTYTVTKCEALDSKIALYPTAASTADEASFTAYDADCTGGTAEQNTLTWHTEAGARLNVWTTNSTGSWVPTNSTALLNVTNFRVLVTEDAEDDADDTTATTFTVAYAWDSTDSEYDVSIQASPSFDTDLDDDDDYDHHLSDFGTYIVEETDDSGKYVYAYIPAKEVTYDMFLMPIASSVVVTSSSSTGAVALNPIAVGMAILDSEASLGSKPYIVVGGPCANTVAAALMGNPADCAAGFVEGKGMIKLYTDKNALLVAGYSGKDTQGASRVLAYYMDYASKFEGTELEVITTNLNSLSVNSVQ